MGEAIKFSDSLLPEVGVGRTGRCVQFALRFVQTGAEKGNCNLGAPSGGRGWASFRYVSSYHFVDFFIVIICVERDSYPNNEQMWWIW